ncbi:hypothetical protein [Micromonospora sp. DT62]|uniref:hypothetical protein n=1 Tax=Micromonospora sp. DT62 TaxID=3416521 RepID=UPI003CF7D599
MKIDDRVEGLVRSVLDAAVHKDTDRLAAATASLGDEATVTKAVELSLAVAAAVLFEVHEGMPSADQVTEISRTIAEQERWSGVRAAEVDSLLQAISTGSPVVAGSGSASAAVPFVVTANLLAAASQPDEGEWWFNYLDKVEAAIEAAG